MKARLERLRLIFLKIFCIIYIENKERSLRNEHRTREGSFGYSSPLCKLRKL